MKRKHLFLISLLLGFITLNIYLFVSAPEKLTFSNNQSELKYSSSDLFNVLARINDEARTLYTNQIVQKGKSVGINFDENWTLEEIEAGPLPALFLRETSANIEKSEVELGLYLGSDYPISQANMFKGIQKKKFEELKTNKKPVYFYDEDTKRNYAMFPDYAVGKACVNCHNEHKESPKKDWELNDIMGATTWSVPMDSLTTMQMLQYMKAYLNASMKTYDKFLNEVKGFKQNTPPEIGDKWPEDGYYLPDSKSFKSRLETLHSSLSLNAILENQ